MSSVNIVITTQQSNHNEWMAFAAWYSVHHNMPDTKVAVIFPRAHLRHHFIWLNKCHIPYLTYGSDITEKQAIANLDLSSNVLVMKDHMMLVREADLSFISGIVYAEVSGLYTKASSDEVLPIIDYHECGNFNLAEWMDKQKKHPFFRTPQLVARNRTVNEQRVFQLWRQMGNTFDFINRP